MTRKLLAILAALAICLAPLGSFAAYQSSTLRNGMRGDEVKEIQQALITLGYLKGTADGIFGNNTEKFFILFQKLFSAEKLSKNGRPEGLGVHDDMRDTEHSASLDRTPCRK
ncbi:MAG: peptidoglycan-binding protein [Clostridia bacterium]|nr:peptidoglycan-binding protein [Clostridia bacterium]